MCALPHLTSLSLSGFTIEQCSGARLPARRSAADMWNGLTSLCLASFSIKESVLCGRSQASLETALSLMTSLQSLCLGNQHAIQPDLRQLTRLTFLEISVNRPSPVSFPESVQDLALNVATQGDLRTAQAVATMLPRLSNLCSLAVRCRRGMMNMLQLQSTTTLHCLQRLDVRDNVGMACADTALVESVCCSRRYSSMIQVNQHHVSGQPRSRQPQPCLSQSRCVRCAAGYVL